LGLREFDRDKIEPILTGFEPPPAAIHAVSPTTRVLPARTQFFIDFLAAQLIQPLFGLAGGGAGRHRRLRDALRR
jgi:hypothetical protein